MADSSDDQELEDYFAGVSPGAQPGAAGVPASSAVPDENYFSTFSPGPAVPAPAAQAQMTGPLRFPAMALHALATGTQNLLGVPGDLEALGNSLVPPNKFTPRNALEAGLAKLHNALTLPTSSGIARATGLGLENRPDLTPTTPLERYGTAAIEALPNAAAIAATGGGAIPALAVSESGAMAAQGAHDLLPESKWAPIVAGTAASLAAGGVTGALAQRAAAKAARGALSDAQNDLIAAQDAALRAPAEAAGAAGRAFESVAGTLGQSQTLQDAGTVLQAAARDWKQNVMPRKLLAVSAPLDAAVPASTPTPLTNYEGALASLTKDTGSLKAASDPLAKDLIRRLQAGMEARNEVMTAPPTWGEARNFRSMIGDAMADPTLVKSIGEQKLSALYSAITKDLGATAEKAGAGQLWQNFNNESTRLYDFAGGPLSRVITSTNPELPGVKPGAAAKAFLSGAKTEGTDLAALRAEMPQAVDELGAAALRQGAWGKLSPEAKAQLVPDPVTGRALDSVVAAHKAAPVAAKQAVRDARKAVTLAATAVPPPSNPLTNLVRTGQHAIGSAFGYELGPWVAAHLGLPGNPLTTAAAMGAGYALPALYRGLKGLPNANLLIPTSGVLAGENALAPTQAQQPAGPGK